MQASNCKRIQLLKDNTVIADKCVVAESVWIRTKGLIGTKEFAKGEGMLFPKCNSVHMWFMSIGIDVVFLRKISGDRLRVSSLRESVRPWKFLPLADFRAHDTLELPWGSIERLRIKVGDELCIS